MEFDQCRNSKNWAPVEIEALNTAASIFGAAVSRLINKQKLMNMDTHDFLTNLPNRLLFEDRFSLAKARADRSKEKLVVISINLDKFKQVNDTWGHPVGDVVLIEIAKRLNNTVRTSDTCAWIGGDEFAVIAEGIHNRSDMILVMQKLDESFIEPILHEKQEIYVRASMAVALFPDTGNDLQELMKAADKALYEVKSSNIRYKIYRKDQYSLLEN
jgi:diguanylate cyclase (GGDEF)-like protein